eukprot:jgi/Ulvmu1/10506/UM064_0044.1
MRAKHLDGRCRHKSCGAPASRRSYTWTAPRSVSCALLCKCIPSSNACSQLVSNHVVLQSAAGPPVYVLGVDHLARQYDLGEFILEEKPDTVVLESALSPEFGSKTGNTLCAQDADAGRSDATALRMLFALSDTLQSAKTPSQSAEWVEVKQRMYGEQLAAVAAMTASARLVYGDVPKSVTFQRLMHQCNCVDLDRSFGHRSAQNYATLLGKDLPALEDDPVERVLMTERESALCFSIDKACTEASASGRSVVAVVGEAHLPGLKSLWDSGEWKRATCSTDWATCAFDAPPAAIVDEKSAGLGVQRALAEAAVGLRGSGLVVNAMSRSLGPIPQDELESYMITSETYGCCRMLLATLQRAMFDDVVAGRGCDFWAELQPLRDLRPVNGGPGHDLGLLIELRELNFDLS